MGSRSCFSCATPEGAEALPSRLSAGTSPDFTRRGGLDPGVFRPRDFLDGVFGRDSCFTSLADATATGAATESGAESILSEGTGFEKATDI